MAMPFVKTVNVCVLTQSFTRDHSWSSSSLLNTVICSAEARSKLCSQFLFHNSNNLHCAQQTKLESVCVFFCSCLRNGATAITNVLFWRASWRDTFSWTSKKPKQASFLVSVFLDPTEIENFTPLFYSSFSAVFPWLML